MSSRGRCRVLRRGTAVGVPGGWMASCGAGRAPAVMEPRFSGGVGKRGLGWCDANRIESTPPQCVSATAFQSSPGPKAGRSSSCAAATCPCPRSGFNPRPARRPGAPAPALRDGHRRDPVSILARPEGRALRALKCCATQVSEQFQSSPGPKAGRSHSPGVQTRLSHRQFQSSPGPKAGRSLVREDVGVGIVAMPRNGVSILARPEGRALQTPRSRPPSRRSCFNPRPARRPGAPSPHRRALRSR